MPTPTRQIDRPIDPKIDPAVYTHNIHQAIALFHQAGSPPQSLPRLQHVVQANYDTLNRAGYFRQGQAQQVGHLLRAQGYAQDPTQGGTVDPYASPNVHGPYGSPTISFSAPPASRPGAVPHMPSAPAQARQAAPAPVPLWRRTADNTFGTGNHEGDIHKAAQAVIPGVKVGYHALDQWSNGLGEDYLAHMGGTTTVRDITPAQHAANARRLLAQAKQGGIALVPPTIKDIAAGVPARTIVGNIVREGRDHPFNFVLNTLPFAEWGALSVLGKAAKLEGLATAVEASGDGAQAARMRGYAATLRRGAQPVHDMVTARPLRQALGRGIGQGIRQGVAVLRRPPLGMSLGPDDTTLVQPVSSKGGSTRPSTKPSSAADAKLAQQIEPGWQKLIQHDQPASNLITVPGLGHFTVKGKTGANVWVQDGNYNLNISPEALHILTPRSGDPTIPTDYMGARLKELHDFAITAKDSQILLPIRKVTPSEAARVHTALGKGIDISGYTHFVDADHIRHILNRHTDPSEALRGQVPLKRDDIAKIPQVLENPDSIEEGETNALGQRTIVYKKRLNGRFVYIVTVAKGKRMLVANTLWKFVDKNLKGKSGN